MPPLRRHLLIILMLVLLTLAGLGLAFWAVNSSWLVGPSESGVTKVLAHRGLHQADAGHQAGTDPETEECRARRIAPVTHEHIANTLPSIRAAVKAGADVVELDVQMTADGHFAVFHDLMLDCQTDGTGRIRAATFAQLRQLDLGHGFTSDGGGSYPLRGTGRGLMPSLTEVLMADPAVPLLINLKSDDPAEGLALAALLERPEWRDRVLGVFGPAGSTQAALGALPGLRGYDRQQVVDCLKPYAAIGWLGRVPEACHDTLIVVPISHVRWLWGWPHRFTRRMHAHGTEVILLGPWDSSEQVRGINSAEALARVPVGFDGYVWTDRIDIVGPLLAARR